MSSGAAFGITNFETVERYMLDLDVETSLKRAAGDERLAARARSSRHRLPDLLEAFEGCGPPEQIVEPPR